MYDIINPEINQIVAQTEYLAAGEVFAVTEDKRVLIIDDSGKCRDVSLLLKAVPKIGLNKEQFTQLLGGLKQIYEKEDKINRILSELYDGSLLFFPTLENELCEYLTQTFHDTQNLIYYFISDLDFGKEWKPGLLKDRNNNEIPLATTEELYDLLLRCYLDDPSVKNIIFDT